MTTVRNIYQVFLHPWNQQLNTGCSPVVNEDDDHYYVERGHQNKYIEKIEKSKVNGDYGSNGSLHTSPENAVRAYTVYMDRFRDRRIAEAQELLEKMINDPSYSRDRRNI